MEAIELGTTGAKRQTWGDNNPRELLRRLAEENPGASEATLFDLFRAECEDYLTEIARYWFANNFRAMFGKREPVNRQAVDQVKASIMASATARVLLDWQLPHGKALRDCTGRECAVLAGSVGSWLGKVAAIVKAEETVGAVLTEEDVKALWLS